MGLLFFPRGGSAQVARSLCRELPTAGWDVTLVSGSVRVPGRPGDAVEFFDGLDVRPVDFTAALEAPDPLRHDPPLHPSYEDRADASDRVFARVGDEVYEHQVSVWARELERAGAADADILHLHHLTPLNEAAERVAPMVPRVGHIHGTELLMLERIAEGAPPDWEHAEEWARRLRRWARGCERLVVLSSSQVPRVQELLGVEAERCTRISNGFDPATFVPRDIDRRAHWRRALVEEPRGWAPGEEAGSVAYAENDLDAFEQGTVLLYVGRFTAVKRLDLLIRAHARAWDTFERPAPLVLVGGFPGEWEGEHPLETIERTGAREVFLAGWHDHADLPDMLAASDVVVLPSVREQFGQVLVEGMACGLPVIAVDRHGPAEVVDHGETGWLIEPDDEEGLATALAEAVNQPEERRRRGAEGELVARERYAWPALAGRLAGVYAAARRAAGEPPAEVHGDSADAEPASVQDTAPAHGQGAAGGPPRGF
jgi:glycosyltransferase involved in cell wall biosynthesis